MKIVKPVARICPGLSSVDRAAQRLNLLTQIVGQFGSAVRDIAHSLARGTYVIFGFVSPVVELLAGVFVAAFQIPPHLLACLRRQQKTCQRSRTESNQQKSDRRADVPAAV